MYEPGDKIEFMSKVTNRYRPGIILRAQSATDPDKVRVEPLDNIDIDKGPITIFKARIRLTQDTI